MVNVYIHRPTPEGGETDSRFREATEQMLEDEGTGIEFWRARGWTRIDYADDFDWIDIGTLWRIPGSDAPSAEMMALAKETRVGAG